MTVGVEQQGQVTQSQDRRASLSRFGRTNALQLGIIGVFLLLWLLLIVAAPSVFRDNGQIYSALMATIPFFGIMALPLTLVVIAREIDLSFGSIMALGMTTFVLVMQRFGADQTGANLVPALFLAALAAVVVGFLVGLINGLIVVRLGIPSLITTLGTQFLWRGLVLIVTNGQSYSLISSQGTLFRNLMVGRAANYFPAQMIWMLLIALVIWLILNRHKFGAHVYLIGDNENSARLMGINVDRTRILVFAIMGMGAAFAGILASMEVNYFWPGTLGEGYLLRTLAAVFLGGTSVFGGTGTIVGTFLACFIVGTIEAGTVAVGLTGYYTQFIFGFIIVLSVALHTFVRRRIS